MANKTAEMLCKVYSLLKNKERDKKANAYMDHLLREHKKSLRIASGLERTTLDKLIDKVKYREANGWEK